MKLCDTNLKVTHYQNGDPIRLAQSDEDWEDAGQKEEGAYCISPTGGYLYNWYAVNDKRGLCRVPTDEEWNQFKDVEVLRRDGLDGARMYDGPFINQCYIAYFWSSSEYNTGIAWNHFLHYDDSDLYRSNYNKNYGFSVRCVEALRVSDTNLKVTHYRNGDRIRNAQFIADWLEANNDKEGAYCISPTGGYLYNWYAVNDPRGLAPLGFRVPTKDDFKILDNVESLRVYDGFRSWYGSFYHTGGLANFWSSSESSSDRAWAISLNPSDSIFHQLKSSKVLGFSVRCVEVEG